MSLLVWSVVFVGVIIALLFVTEIFASRRAQKFAARHGLRSMRGSIDRASTLVGSVAGRPVQIESERRMLPRGGTSVRTVFLVETNTRNIGVLRRYRSRFLEFSQANALSGMKRVQLPTRLANEFELWVPAGSGAKEVISLNNEEVALLLQGFWALHEIQWLGGQLVVRLNGDVSHTSTMERAWLLVEQLIHGKKAK